MRLRRCFFIVLPVIFTGFSHALAAAASDVEIRDAWIKAAAVTARPSAGYFSMINHTEEAARLVSVTSESARNIMIHATKRENNVMRMTRQNQIDIAANQTLSFAPNTLHLMIFGLDTASDTIIIEFGFADGRTISAPFKICPVNSPEAC